MRDDRLRFMDMVVKEKRRRLFEDADRKMREGHFTEFKPRSSRS